MARFIYSASIVDGCSDVVSGEPELGRPEINGGGELACGRTGVLA